MDNMKKIVCTYVLQIVREESVTLTEVSVSIAFQDIKINNIFIKTKQCKHSIRNRIKILERCFSFLSQNMLFLILKIFAKYDIFQTKQNYIYQGSNAFFEFKGFVVFCLFFVVVFLTFFLMYK